MFRNTLSDFVEATATKFGIPGVAVGVWVGGFFTRDQTGAVVGVDLAGRLFSRAPVVSP